MIVEYKPSVRARKRRRGNDGPKPKITNSIVTYKPSTPEERWDRKPVDPEAQKKAADWLRKAVKGEGPQ